MDLFGIPNPEGMRRTPTGLFVPDEHARHFLQTRSLFSRGVAGGGGGGGGGDGTEPVDPGSGYLWSDNFDRYDSVIGMQSDGGCGVGTPGFGIPSAHTTYGKRTMANNNNGCTDLPAWASLVTGRGGAGQALRATIPTGPGGYAWLSPRDPNDFGPYSSSLNLVIQFWFRASVNFSPGGGGIGGTKWMEMRYESHADPNGNYRVQWGLDQGTQACPLWSAVLGSNPGGTVNRTTQPVGSYWNTLNDANWHRFTCLFKANTSTTYSNTSGSSSATETYTGSSSRDGRIAAWVDGTKIMDYSQAAFLAGTPSGGTNPWCYQGDVDMIPANTGQTLQFTDVVNNCYVAGTLDHDEIKVWTLP